MVVAILCSCGKRLRVRDEMKGKRVRCPGCQRPVEVPGDEAPVAAEPKPEAAARAWLVEHLQSENIVVLTREALFIAKVAEEYRRPVAKAIEEGADPRGLLGDSFQYVLLSDMAEVTMDRNAPRLGSSLTIQFHREGRVRTLMVFWVKEVCDEVFAALQERLGRGWRLQERQLSRQEVMRTDLIVQSILFGVMVGCLVLHQFVLDPQTSPTLRQVAGWTGVVIACLSVFLLAISVRSLIKPPLLATLRPRRERVPVPPLPQGAHPGAGWFGWSRLTWVCIAIGVIGGVRWILGRFGIDLPPWLHWTIVGLMLAALIWAWWTDPTNIVQKKDEEERAEDASEPAPAPETPAPEAPARQVVVLPEGCEPAELELRCVGCQQSGLMRMPANQVSRQRQFVCPHCGTLMRPPWRKALFVGTAVLGCLGILFGLLLLFALEQGPYAGSDVREKGAGGIAVLGAVVAMWAVAQLRLSPPLGAVPRPRTIRPLVIGAVLIALLLLLVFGAYFVLMFLIDKAF